MKRFHLCVGWAATSVALGAGGCARRVPESTPPAAVAPTSNEALALELPRFPSNERYRLAEDAGKVVLLDIWATWCQPCWTALPHYAQLLAKYREQGFVAYAVSVDADRQKVSEFVAETQLSLPILYDEEAAFSESKLGVRLMPTTFLIDRKGKVRHVHEGFVVEDLPGLEHEIQTLLAEPKE